MRYDISKPSAPKMPNLGKGTECIKILLSQVSENMQEPMVPMFFPILGAHISGTEFQYPDNSWKEPTGMMTNLVAHSGDNKGQFKDLTEAICRDFREHDMASLADLADDDLLFEISHRSLVSAWKAGCVLWVLNNQTWTKSMGELVEWLVYHDLWSKMAVFADMLKDGDTSLSEVVKTGPKNMLDNLPDSFNEAQLEALRVSVDKPKDGTKRQLRVWKNRGFITYSELTGLYSKTEDYLNGK